VRKYLGFPVFVLLIASAAIAQNGPQYKQPEGGVPVLTGFVGLGTSFQPDQQQLSPTISPIVLVPFGEKWLVESELELEGDYTHTTNQPWDHAWAKGVEYAQIDYLANRYVTVVGGRFLTPFGIFNERLHSGWIRNVQTAPYITAMEMTDSTGGMLRGAIPVGNVLNINYAGFFSASVNNSWVGSTRAAGERVSFFFPKARFEIGTSIQRQLQDEHINTYGADITWQSNRVPLDVRGEYVRNRAFGSGYWLEGAYRMRKAPFWKPLMRKSQAEIRFEQFFAPSVVNVSAGDMGLPASNAKRIFAGWSYWIRPDVRANFAYGREFITEGDHNVWTVGLTYRFAFPLMGGRK
jgi:hypothetical protein